MALRLGVSRVAVLPRRHTPRSARLPMHRPVFTSGRSYHLAAARSDASLHFRSSREPSRFPLASSSSASSASSSSLLARPFTSEAEAHAADQQRLAELEAELEQVARSKQDYGLPKDYDIRQLPWTPNSRRIGVVGKKLGMMQLWDAHGTQFPVTVISLADSQVLAVKSRQDKHGRIGLQIAADNAKPKNVTKSILTVFRRSGIPAKRKIVEFRITPDAILPPGFTIDARHFVPGQYVDIQGRTVGKGFQGAMKRWGFGGQSASHGASLSHRSLGATGACQNPGKVWKGKKMAGHMGNRVRTIQSMRVFRVDPIRQLVLIHGSVPGKPGNYVILKDAYRKPFTLDNPPPFPTFVPDPQEDVSQLDPHDPAFSIDQSKPETFWPISRGGMAV